MSSVILPITHRSGGNSFCFFIFCAEKELKTDKMKEPQMEDFYDELDPRGISSTEYNEYLKALEEYERSTRGNLV